MGQSNRKPLFMIFGEEIELRPLCREYLSLTRTWRNLPEIRQWFKSSDAITIEQHNQWFESYRKKEDDYVFVVFDLKEDKPVGQVAIYNINRVDLTAEVGRFISSPDYQGKGLMRNACLVLLKFSFAIMGLRNIYLEVFSNNERAINMYKSIGFYMIDHDKTMTKMCVANNSYENF